METHVSLTYTLLDKLPYPEHLEQVPFYAGCHHEKLNGEGYPNGYSGDKLPMQARIIFRNKIRNIKKIPSITIPKVCI